MVNMKTAKCPTCGGIVLKLAGKASKLCHDECLDCRKKRAEAAAVPACSYCDAVHGLRRVHDGYGSVPPEYTCETCFTGQDDGPCFDDLPEVKRQWHTTIS